MYFGFPFGGQLCQRCFGSEFLVGGSGSGFWLGCRTREEREENLPPRPSIVLSFRGDATWELSHSRCREGDGDCVASAGSAAAAPFAVAAGGSPGTGWWSYSVSAAPLRPACLKLEGHGLKKRPWLIKISKT